MWKTGDQHEVRRCRNAFEGQQQLHVNPALNSRFLPDKRDHIGTCEEMLARQRHQHYLPTQDAGLPIYVNTTSMRCSLALFCNSVVRVQRSSDSSSATIGGPSIWDVGTASHSGGGAHARRFNRRVPRSMRGRGRVSHGTENAGASPSGNDAVRRV
jgi:hypothetical protein